MEITVADDISAEYRGLVQSILDNPEFKKLQRYKQHFQTTRFMHSLNVSYISWLIARKLGWDAQTADRKSTRLNSSHITRYRMPSSA